MFVKMLTTMAGVDGVVLAGQETDLPEKKAVELVAGGYAVYCNKTTVVDVVPAKEAAIEAAVIKQPETAEKKLFRRKNAK